MKSQRKFGIPVACTILSLFSYLTIFSTAEAFFHSLRSTLVKMKPSLRINSFSDSSSEEETVKRIVFIRHGRTYMNDFINGIHYGTPGFTDVFPDTEENNYKYKDSPLAPTGLDEVKALNELLRNLKENRPGASEALSLSEEDSRFLEELDLVVTSPLTRALQTMEMGLYEHIRSRDIPIMALPEAAERIYLISDHGKTRSQLKRQYEFVDFDSGFDPELGEHDSWHYTPSAEDIKNYEEWRPHGEGQVYATLGESQDYFDLRMSRLYHWLNTSKANTIAVVCHAGVIDWMLQEIFDNCELRIVSFDKLKPRALRRMEE